MHETLHQPVLYGTTWPQISSPKNPYPELQQAEVASMKNDKDTDPF
jgi:hypothetical protein